MMRGTPDSSVTSGVTIHFKRTVFVSVQTAATLHVMTDETTNNVFFLITNLTKAIAAW